MPDLHKGFKIPPQPFTLKLESVIYAEKLENLDILHGSSLRTEVRH
jgi:hypothetical protein